jgi:NAD(P)H-hydrate epimerase
MSEIFDPQPVPNLPARDPEGHKGTFGSVVVIGGSEGGVGVGGAVMIGAPALAGRAALRAGCGLCKVVAPASVLHSVLALLPSATGITIPVDAHSSIVPHEAARAVDAALAAASCIVLGPGLGTSAGVDAIVLRVLQQESVPVVVDADAISALARIPELSRDFRAPAILTPHPGEFARLAVAMKISLDPVSKPTRPDAARSLAQRLGCVVVLKGAGTIVSDGVRTWRCDAGHPCLATAGTGDVLAGLLGGLIAQFHDPLKALVAGKHAGTKSAGTLSLYDLARLATLVHAKAGEQWGASHASAGLLAMELADLLPPVIDAHRAEAQHLLRGSSRVS